MKYEFTVFCKRFIVSSLLGTFLLMSSQIFGVEGGIRSGSGGYYQNNQSLLLLAAIACIIKQQAAAPYAEVTVHYYQQHTYFGHVAFEINKDFRKYYSYPDGNDEKAAHNFYGKIKSSVTLPLSREQYERFIDWYQNSLYSQFEDKNKILTYVGHYHPIKFSCAHFVKYSLRAMGYDINHFSLKPLLPSTVIKRVKKIAESIEKGSYQLDLEKVTMNYIQKKEIDESQFKGLELFLHVSKQLLRCLYPNFNEYRLFREAA